MSASGTSSAPGLRVLIVGGVPARLHEGPVDWAGHRFETTRHQLKRFADYRTAARDVIDVDAAGLEAFVDATEGFDAVLCESPEALILAREWARRGRAPRAIIAIEVQGLLRVRALRRWYLDREGVDPWPEVAAAPWIVWQVGSPGQRELLMEAGVPEARIHAFPSSTALMSSMSPDADARLDGGPEADGAAADGIPEISVLVPGSGGRDRELALRAAALAPELDFTIIDEHAARHLDRLASGGVSVPANVRFLAPVPLERYFALVRRASLVVVPISPDIGAAGQMTVALAQRLGVAVVCTASQSLVDYVDGGRAARLVPTGEPVALASAIRELMADGASRARLAAAGRELEAARALRAREGLLISLSQASAGASADPIE